MPKYKISAEFKNPADQKYNPEWEAEVSASLIGEAIAQGEVLFLPHCAEKQLDRALFDLHAGTC